MTMRITRSIVALALLASARPMLAHHSLLNHDPTPIRISGAVVQIHLINPHSIVYVDVRQEDGQMRRWALEGPAGFQFERRGLRDVLEVGDAIEVCGYSPREALVWQVTSPNAGLTSMSGRLITAEALTTPDGKTHSWSDYGLHKCFPEGYRDQHAR